MEIKSSLYKLFFFLVMFMYVFSCQYSQNKNEISSNKKQNISNKMRKPGWVFDSRLIVNEQEVLASGLNLWRVGDGTDKKNI